MKILKIIIQNIHSLAGEHVIDFTQPPLADSGIFAITGPTGSGKSTILDAITLALYGNISRFTSSRPATIKNHGAIVTRGRKKAKAEVYYHANDQVYHSVWSYANGKTQMQLFDQHENIIANGNRQVVEKNIEFIGLNFNQFVRAVILPQGQFDKFLKADSDDRIKILEQLTGTEIYRELSIKAFEITKQKRIELDALKQRIQDIKLLNQNQLADIKEKIEFFEELDAFLDKKAQTVQKQIQIKQQINTLQQKLQDLNKNLQNLLEQKQKLEPELKRLDLHKKILPHAPKIEKYNNLKQQITTLQKQIEQLKLKAQNLKQQSDEQELEKNKISKELNNLQIFIENAEPLIGELQNIEKQINALNELTQNKQKDEKYIQSKLNSISDKIQQITRQTALLNDKYKKINQWLTQNQSLENLTSDLKIFENIAQDYSRLFTSLKQALNQKPLNQLKTHLPLDNPEQALKSIDYQINELNAKLYELKQKIQANADKNALLDQQKQINAQLQAISKTQGLVTSLDKLKAQIKQLDEQTQSLNQQKHKLFTQQNNQKQLIKVLQNKLKIAEIELENQRIANSSSYIRQKLNDGDSCPVCGNTYHHHTAPKLQQIDLKQYQDKVEHQRNELEQANQLLTKISADINNIDLQIQDKQKQIENYKSQIQQIQNDIKAILNKHNIHIQSYDNQALQQKIHELQQTAEKINNQILLIDKTLQLQQTITIYSNIKQQLAQLNELKQKLSELRQKYKAHIGKITKINLALNRLHQLHQQWQDYTSEKQHIEKQLTELNSALKSLNEQKKVIASELQDIQNQIQNNLNELKSLKQQQTNILSQLNYDKILTAAQIQDDFHKRLQTLQKSLSSVEQNLTQLTTSLNETNSNIDQLQKQKQTLTNELETFEKQLNQLLTSLGFDNILQAQNALLPEQKAKAIEQQNQQINESLSAIKKQITDTQHELQNLQTTDTSAQNLQTLENLLQKLSTQLKNIQQKIGGLEEEINSNKRQQATYEQLINQLKQAEADLSHWEDLNELIGSAEGDKFQRLVQELNLRELIAEANKHLSKLAPRYQLWYQKFDTNKKLNLELIVIDNHMGGEKRSVKTLSGGESFLVSLALALGLSSLASYKISLKNLFIDEGFGSLDNQSLDMVLSTLEKLQTDTNRQIGIISHLEALKERIPVKINLVKLSGGLSKISITYM